MYGDRFGDSRGGGGFRGGGGNRFGGNDRAMTPPVKEGEEIDVTIESVGEKGDGMAKVQGFVLFVPGTKAGERVKVRVTRVLAKVGFAQSIGPATSAAPAAGGHERHQKAPEPAFDPKEELDSEDFGDESEDDEEDDSEEDK